MKSNTAWASLSTHKCQPHQAASIAETQNDGIAIIHNGKRYRWIEQAPAEIIEEVYCVALLGADGMVIPGSRLSGDFSSPCAAFATRDELRKQYPDADVFGSLIVDRLAALS